MLEGVVGMGRLQDLPVCFPGRSCVDEPPGEADVVNLLSALTPISPVIAVVCFAALAVALVLVVIGLRRQWRGAGVRPWLVVLVAVLLLVGFVVAEVVAARSGTIAEIYSGVDGQGPGRPPASLTGWWPSVLVASDAMLLLGALALVALIATAVAHRRRVVRA